MSPVVVLITVAAYFLLLFAVSHVASRRTDNTGFFTGNRRAPWVVVAIATVGAAISGVTFISVPGMVVDKGYSYLQMVLGFIVGYWIIAFVLVPLFYKRNLVSIYGYLGERFGLSTYRTGAWFFIVSKMLGASVRFFVVCIVLQALVCDPLGVPFWANVAVTVGIVWLYTFRGGVKSVIWTDLLKSFCLILSVVLCIVFIARNLDLDFAGVVDAVGGHSSSRVFFFDDPSKGVYFWKQFVAGIFMAIAINGLDQDMMQRNLACRDSARSRKNMLVSGVMQFFVIALFLLLGTLLVVYIDGNPSLSMPEKSDEIFGLVASHDSLPPVVGILFVLGLVAAAYSAAGSALVSLTTSFIVDILGKEGTDEIKLARVRRLVHAGMAVMMGVVIIVFYVISEDDAISAVYTLASYTYGPILGLFAFGMFTSLRVNDKIVPFICVAAPAACLLTRNLLFSLWGYEMSFELLLLNAFFTFALLSVASAVKSDRRKPVTESSL